MLPVWRQTQSVLLLNNCIFQPAVGDVPIADFLYIKLKILCKIITVILMEFAKIIILSVTAMVVLFLLTKLMGYRQINEMSFFDYVIGITIGSIAAEMSTNLELEWWKGITAMAVWAIIGLLLSVITQKSIKARRFISGEPIIIMQKGKVIKKNLKKAKLDIDDLIASARVSGYFNLTDVDSAIMETTGSISFMPTPQKRPLNPKDFNFAPIREGLSYDVICDGKFVEKEIEKCPIDKNEIKKILANRETKMADIALGSIDENKQLTILTY